MKNEIFVRKTIAEEDEGADLIHYLSLLFGDLHKAALRELVDAGFVVVDGEKAFMGQRLRTYSLIEVKVPVESGIRLRKRKVSKPGLNLLYEDRHCLVVDKPTGVPVIPERHYDVDTVQDLMPGGEDLQVVQRLDRDTSGCLVLARTLTGAQHLEQQFSGKQVEECYLALARGNLGFGDNRVDHWIGPARGRANRMRAVSAEQRDKGRKIPCKEACTDYRARESFPGLVLLEARPRTVRTHQVRVHLSAVGLPLVADPLYSHGLDKGLFLSEFKPGYRPKRGQTEEPLLGRLALHAESIIFASPESGELVRISAPMPADFTRALARLRHFVKGRVTPELGDKGPE